MAQLGRGGNEDPLEEVEKLGIEGCDICFQRDICSQRETW